MRYLGYTKYIKYILFALLTITLVGVAEMEGIDFINGVLTYATVTDSTIAYNVDTANGLTRGYIIRLADSAAANRTTGFRNPEAIWVDAFANFRNNATDSTSMQFNGNVFNTCPLMYDMYLDKLSIRTDDPDGLDPMGFDYSLPRISTDSALMFILSRSATFPAGQRGGLTVYKVPIDKGLSQTGLYSTFYDMIRFDENVFKLAGNQTQVVATVSLVRVH